MTIVTDERIIIRPNEESLDEIQNELKACFTQKSFDSSRLISLIEGLMTDAYQLGLKG